MDWWLQQCLPPRDSVLLLMHLLWASRVQIYWLGCLFFHSQVPMRSSSKFLLLLILLVLVLLLFFFLRKGHCGSLKTPNAKYLIWHSRETKLSPPGLTRWLQLNVTYSTYSIHERVVNLLISYCVCSSCLKTLSHTWRKHIRLFTDLRYLCLLSRSIIWKSLTPISRLYSVMHLFITSKKLMKFSSSFYILQ